MANSKSKIVSIIIVLILALGAVYYFFFYGGAPSSENTSQIGDVNISEIEGASAIFLSKLNELKAVQLDKSIFQDQAFVKLVSFEKPIPDQPSGRDNPFAPVAGMVVSKSNTVSRPGR